jgi:hypothetical protein
MGSLIFMHDASSLQREMLVQSLYHDLRFDKSISLELSLLPPPELLLSQVGTRLEEVDVLLVAKDVRVRLAKEDNPRLFQVPAEVLEEAVN